MRTSLLLATALSLSAPSLAAAQAEPGPGGMMRHWPDRPQMLKREADDLAIILDLTPDKRPALEAFLAANGPPERPMGPPPARLESAPSMMGFEQHLQEMEAHSARHAAAEKARIEAARAFYAVLDTHQKLVFEALMRLRHGPGGAGHGPDGHGPGGPGPEGPPPRP